MWQPSREKMKKLVLCFLLLSLLSRRRRRGKRRYLVPQWKRCSGATVVFCSYHRPSVLWPCSVFTSPNQMWAHAKLSWHFSQSSRWRRWAGKSRAAWGATSCWRLFSGPSSSYKVNIPTHWLRCDKTCWDFVSWCGQRLLAAENAESWHVSIKSRYPVISIQKYHQPSTTGCRCFLTYSASSLCDFDRRTFRCVAGVVGSASVKKKKQ